jgi:hypothetical protein
MSALFKNPRADLEYILQHSRVVVLRVQIHRYRYRSGFGRKIAERAFSLPCFL